MTRKRTDSYSFTTRWIDNNVIGKLRVINRKAERSTPVVCVVLEQRTSLRKQQSQIVQREALGESFFTENVLGEGVFLFLQCARQSRWTATSLRPLSLCG